MFWAAAAVLVAAVWGSVLLVQVGPRRMAHVAGMGGAFFAPMVMVRVATSLTVGDLILVAAVALAVLARLSSGERIVDLRVVRAPAVLLGLVIVGALLGLTTVGGGGFGDLVRFATGSGAVLTFVAVQRPNAAHVGHLAVAAAAGAVFSGSYGLLVGGMSHPDGRLFGLAGHANHLGLSNALGLGCALGVALTRGRSNRARPVAILLAPASFAMVVISGSRASFVAVVVIFAVIAWQIRRPRVTAAIGAVVIVGIVGIGAGVVPLADFSAISRLAGNENAAASNVEREERLKTTLDRLDDSLILGNGFFEPLSAHSVPLQLWLGAGVLGLFAWVYFIGATLREVRRAVDATAVCLWGAVAGMLVGGVVSNQLWDRYIWVPIALAAASSHRASNGRGEPSPQPTPRRTGAALR